MKRLCRIPKSRSDGCGGIWGLGEGRAGVTAGGAHPEGGERDVGRGLWSPAGAERTVKSAGPAFGGCNGQSCQRGEGLARASSCRRLICSNQRFR